MEEDPIQPVHEVKETNGDAKKPEDKPPVIPVNIGEVSSPKDTGNPKKDAKKRKRKPLSCFEVWTIILGSLGILVAAGTGFAIYRQDEIASATLEELQKQYPKLQESADAADSAAKTAHSALNFTKELEEPYISLESVVPSGFPEGKNPGFILTFRNSGRNLAINVSGNGTMTFNNINRPLPALDPKGNFVLPPIPGGSAAVQWMAVADEQFFELHRSEIKLGTAHFYVRGVIRWESSDGIKYPGRNFCLVYNPNPARPTSIGILDYCPQNQQNGN